MTKSTQEDIADKSVAIIEPQTQEVVAGSIYGTMTVAELKKATKTLTEQREVISKWIASQLIEGVDYGKIHINSKCPNKWEPKKCKIEGHWSKPSLFKPGQEKIFSLMNLTSRLEKDVPTMEMLAKEQGTHIAYICQVFRGNMQVAEGRGACTVGLNGRDVNSSIKIAEKRARMDACLSLGFSEFFTQDAEDPEYRNGFDNTPAETKKSAPVSNMATDKQKNYLKGIIKKLVSIVKVTEKELFELYQLNGMNSIDTATSKQASEFINAAKKGALKYPETIAKRLADKAEGVDEPHPEEHSQDIEIIEEGEIVGEVLELDYSEFRDRAAVVKNTLIMEYDFSEEEADLLITYWAMGEPLDPPSAMAVSRIEGSVMKGKKWVQEALKIAKERA